MAYIYRGTKAGKNDPWQAPNRRPRPKHSTYTPSPCGTDAGYKQHLYYREPPCDACLTATREYQRAWRAENQRHTPRTLQPCGTYGAAIRHYRNGEKPCDACRTALRAYKNQKKATTT